MYNHRSNQLSLLSGYPEPAATQIRTRGLRPARDGYKFKKKKNFLPSFLQGQFPSGGVNNRLSAPNLNGGDPFATREGGGGGGPLNATHINGLPRSNSLDTPSNNHVSLMITLWVGAEIH